MKRKINPKWKPATQADVIKAKKEAQNQAISYTWAIFFSVLRDKEGYGKTRLRRIWDEVNYLSDSISKGHVNIKDLIQTLKEEANINLE